MAGADDSALPVRVVHDNGGMSVVARRAGAVLEAISAALHAVMLGHSGNAASAVLVAVMNLAMVAVHLPVSGSHHVTHVVVEAVVPQSVVMTIAMALSMIEVVVAVAVLCYRSRGNARVFGRGN